MNQNVEIVCLRYVRFMAALNRIVRSLTALRFWFRAAVLPLHYPSIL